MHPPDTTPTQDRLQRLRHRSPLFTRVSAYLACLSALSCPPPLSFYLVALSCMRPTSLPPHQHARGDDHLIVVPCLLVPIHWHRYPLISTPRLLSCGPSYPWMSNTQAIWTRVVYPMRRSASSSRTTPFLLISRLYLYHLAAIHHHHSQFRPSRFGA